MGLLIYSLLLIFFIIPVSLRAYLSLKNGRLPLPHFQNNVVVNRVKLRNAIGVFSPIIFWVLHVAIFIGALAIDAWISALAVVVYMVVSPMLSAQIKRLKIGVIPQAAAPTQGGDEAN